MASIEFLDGGSAPPLGYFRSRPLISLHSIRSRTGTSGHPPPHPSLGWRRDKPRSYEWSEPSCKLREPGPHSFSAAVDDYIFFEIIMTDGSRAWCSERADYYRDQYLLYAATFGTGVSGSWNKWYRYPGTAFDWAGPITDSNFNDYGTNSVGAYSWSAEDGIFYFENWVTVNPSGPDDCETLDRQSGDCSYGSWQLTIRVAPDRMSACGF